MTVVKFHKIRFSI